MSFPCRSRINRTLALSISPTLGLGSYNGHQLIGPYCKPTSSRLAFCNMPTYSFCLYCIKFVRHEQLQQFLQNLYRQCNAFACTIYAKIDVFERCGLYEQSTLIGLQQFTKADGKYNKTPTNWWGRQNAAPLKVENQSRRRLHLRTVFSNFHNCRPA